ncbi:MAG: PEGA domain-containing protein [Methanoregula sp.]|jgi:hypothetical protein
MNTRAFIVLVLFSLLVIPLPVPGSMADGLSAGDSGTDLLAFNPNPRITTVTTTSSLSRGIITTVTPAIGTLMLDSVPSGASVYIDGSVMGTTPFTLRTLSSGNHQAVLKLNGYQDYSRTVNIPGGGLVEETWTLVAVPTTTITTLPVRRDPPTTTITTFPVRGEIPTTTPTIPTVIKNPVTGITTPMPIRVPVVVTTTPGIQKTFFPTDYCHYDTATAQCTGTCPQTGKKCQLIKDSGCGEGQGASPVKCGCVDPYSHVSLASAGLVTAESYEVPGFVKTEPQRKGFVDSITGFARNILKGEPVDLSSADPRAYTMETTMITEAQRTAICPEDMFRTVLAFEKPESEFIDTTKEDQRGYFVWDSADPRIGSVVWQASVLPFPPTSEKLSEVPGLVAQGNLLGTQHSFTIDFSESVPTSAEIATVWSDRRSMLTVQKNALVSIRNQLSAEMQLPADTASAGNVAAQTKQLADLDIAITKSTARVLNPTAVSLPSLSKGTVKPAVPSGQSTYQIASGVMAPALSAPKMTKEGIASSLPQAQRTFFIRVVPFDRNGNATGNPSNMKEVVVGEPQFDVTGPWSGWDAIPSFDQDGFSKPPEMAPFMGKTFFFNVRDNHRIYVSTKDATGSATGWSEVPGSFLTDQRVVAIALSRPILGSSKNSTHLYLFATTIDNSAMSGVWYTRMDMGGTWDGWKPLPQKEAVYRYTLERAVILHGDIYVFAQFFQRKYHEDMSYTTPPVTYVYQHLISQYDQPDKWETDWGNPQVWAVNGRIIGGGQIDPTKGCIVEGRPGLPNQFRMNIYTMPLVSKDCKSCNPEITMDLLQQVDVPRSVSGSSADLIDLTATVAHERLYLFLRDKDGHIYMNWMPFITNPASHQLFGTLHDWEDISPGSVAESPGIVSVPSADGSGVDVFAYDVEKPTQSGTGSLLSFLDILQTSTPTLYRNSLSMVPETTQLLVSNTGDRTKNFGGGLIWTGYKSRDINISWSTNTPYWFAWNSSRPDLSYAEWQVSVRPFDEINPRFDETGIVARGRLDANTTDTDYIAYGTGEFVGNALPSYAQKVHLFPVSFNTFGTPANPAKPGVTPYYLRVLTVALTDMPGRYSANASRQIEVDWGPQDTLKLQFCTPPKFYYYDYQIPEISIVGYTPIQPQAKDYNCHGVVTTGYDWWVEGVCNKLDAGDMTDRLCRDMYWDETDGGKMTGEAVNLCAPPDTSFWDEFWECVKGVVDLLKTMVNSIADAYNGLKSGVASAVCGGNAVCQFIVESGINYAMAAMGVPPTIPNFDELMDKGIDYIAASVAEESSVPGADIAVKAALKEMAKEMQHKPTTGDPMGIQLDPKYQYKSATLLIEIRNNDPNNMTAPGSFRVRDSWALFKTMQPDIPYPSLSPRGTPGDSLIFPVVLREDQWKGFSCSSGLEGSSEQESGSCYDIYAGKINKGWWLKYQEAWATGDSFYLTYQGLTPNFTTNMTEKMSHEYGVPLNNYKPTGGQDAGKPDCWKDKYGLIFQPYDSSMKKYNSPNSIASLSLDSLKYEWGNVKKSE